MHEGGFVVENLGVLTLAGGSKVSATLDAELPERLSRVKEVERVATLASEVPVTICVQVNACDNSNTLSQFGQF